MGFSRTLGMLAAFVTVAVASATAWAQDYTVSQVSGQWITPPSTATDFGLTGDDSVKSLTFPFPIPYYGKTFTSCSVSTNGFFQFGGGAQSGCCSPTGGAMASGSTYDGVCSVAWTDLLGVAGTLTPSTKYWVEGTAPNRRFVFAWLNWSRYSTYSGTLNFQIQINESSGRIVMAYLGGWTAGTSLTYGVGMDEPAGANRYVRPDAGQTNGLYTFTSSPSIDWQFDPKITNFTGRVLFDRIVVTGSGIGPTIDANLPLSGMTVELRGSTGLPVASAVTNAFGDFAIRGMALVGTEVGSLVATAQAPSAIVRTTTGGAALGFTLATGVAFNADRDVGTLAISSSNDAAGTARAPLNIVRTIQGVYDWATPRTANPIPQLEVLYDPNSIAPTIYNKPSTAPAQMRVSGTTTNPDPWDNSVITRTYARHVLGFIAAHPTSGMNTAFDAVSDQENAFAEGFGYYLYAAVSGDTQFIDGLSSSSANTIAMENPTLTSSAGPDIAGWVAAGLYDLVDASNEAWDTIDGTGANTDRAFRTVDSLTAPVTTSTFYVAWGGLGYDGPGLSRNFIRHGLVGDDADEPNDNVTEPKVVTQFGFVRNTRILNLYNEDWFQFVMPEPTSALNAQVSIDRTKFNTQIVLELRNLANAVIATGPQTSIPGIYKAITGPLAAGTYRIRVAHVSGVRLADYSVQTFSKLEFSSGAFQPWTVGRPYNVPVNIKGGIPPYSLAIDSPFVVPPGLLLDGANARVRGNPSQEGLYNFILSAKDSANPNASASGPVSFTVNPELTSEVGEFVAFPLGKVVDREIGFVGGTAPYAVSIDEGVLPAGITATGGPDLSFAGTATVAGSTHATIGALDIAGSGLPAAVQAVVCGPLGTTDLAFGSSACGFYFDAVQGSTVGISVKTVARQPKRALRIAVLDQDGTTALAAKTRGGKGSASVSGFTAPATGRYFCVVASDDGDATQLVATAKIVADKSGTGDNGPNNFVAGKTFAAEVGALAGAQMTFTATPDDSGLALKAIYLIDPNGTIVTFDADDVVAKGKGLTITHTLNVTGTWQVLLGALPGPQGHFKYSFKLKQPKDVIYSAD